MRMTVKEGTAPLPASGTAVNRYSSQVGQNSLGGMASSPHLPQRIPVSRPARASSKKCFRVNTCSVTAEEAHDDGGRIAAEGVREPGASALDLTRSRLAPELGDDFRDLGGAGGADGMALGLEAARGLP